MSKQRGSRARELGQRVAERLGWQCFDREILEAIARQSSMRDRILSRLAECAVGALEDVIAQIVVPHRPPQLAYIQEMVRVIWAMARHGNVVFLGRGANWLLDPRYGLRVRAVAPLDTRARRIAIEEGLDPVSAERRVKADDETGEILAGGDGSGTPAFHIGRFSPAGALLAWLSCIGRASGVLAISVP